MIFKAALAKKPNATVYRGSTMESDFADCEAAVNITNRLAAPGWMNRRSATRRLKGNGLHRFRLGHHQQIEHPTSRFGRLERLSLQPGPRCSSR
jgi:hypothetical protein